MAETRKTAHWARTAVTTGGLDLLTDYAAGRVLEITAAYGSSAAEGDISTLTDLPDGKAHPLTIESVVKSKDHVTICIQVSSVGVTEAYKLEQIGIYAASGDTNGYRTEERLLMVIEDEADENGSKGVTVPIESDQLYTFKLYAVLAITNKDRLEVNLSSAGLATLESVQLAISQALGKETPPLEDSGAPTEETAGSIGQTYTDTETGESYTCTGVTEDGRYIWTPGAVGTLDQIRKATGENTAEIAAIRQELLNQGGGNVTMAGGAEITVPEDWGPGPWTLEITEEKEGNGDSGSTIPENLDLELLYSYDGTEGKTLTDFNCGDAKLLLIKFSAVNTNINTSSTIITTSEHEQSFDIAASKTYFTKFLFHNGVFGQTMQRIHEFSGEQVDSDTIMVVRRIYAIKGFKSKDTGGNSGENAPHISGYVGEIVYFADSILRPNHVWADGGAIDAQQWPELAEHAAAAGWAQNEAGQYLTPDLRGRFPLGANDDHAVGSVGGEEKHTLTVEEMPKHSHVLANKFAEAGGGQSSGIQISYSNTQYNYPNTQLAGSSEPHNNMPPYYTVTPQIRAKVDVVYAKTPESIPASDVTYNNTTSGLQADKVQGAVDKVAERTEGLINIDDITFTIDNFTITESNIKVVNGVLCGIVIAHSSGVSTVVSRFNYNIQGRVAVFHLDNGEKNNALTPQYTDGVSNNPTLANTADVRVVFSCPWNPTWTKKEDV